MFRGPFPSVTGCVLFLGSPEAPGIFKQRPPISVAPSSPLLPLHEEVEALLFLSEGKPYLLEVCIGVLKPFPYVIFSYLSKILCWFIFQVSLVKGNIVIFPY